MSSLEVNISNPTTEFINRFKRYSEDNGYNFTEATSDGLCIIDGRLSYDLKLFAETIWEYCEANDIIVEIYLNSREKLY